MTLNEWGNWLEGHPDAWKIWPDKVAYDHTGILVPVPKFPAIYSEFLERFGDIETLSVAFLTRNQCLERAVFIRSLNCEDINHDHLVPFCSLGADCMYYCFDRERVVLFDPLETSLFEDTVVPSFEEFLDKILSDYGEP